MEVEVSPCSGWAMTSAVTSDPIAMLPSPARALTGVLSGAPALGLGVFSEEVGLPGLRFRPCPRLLNYGLPYSSTSLLVVVRYQKDLSVSRSS